MCSSAKKMDVYILSDDPCLEQYEQSLYKDKGKWRSKEEFRAAHVERGWCVSLCVYILYGTQRRKQEKRIPTQTAWRDFHTNQLPVDHDVFVHRFSQYFFTLSLKPQTFVLLTPPLLFLPVDERDAIQKKTFTKWINKHLIKVSAVVKQTEGKVRGDWKIICPASCHHNLVMLMCVCLIAWQTVTRFQTHIASSTYAERIFCSSTFTTFTGQ